MSDKTELDLDAERASFEAWARDHRYDVTKCGAGSRIGPADSYTNTATAHAWDVWLAARRATIQPTAALPPLPKPECLLPGVYAYREACMEGYGAACYAVGRGAAVRDYISLGAAPADAVRDAERYQWLCDQFGVTKFPIAIERLLDGGYGCNYVADGKPGIDAAIDAAMKSNEAKT